VTEIAAVTKRTMRDYQKHITKRGKANGHPYSKASVAASNSALKTFFRLMAREGLVLGNPSDGLAPVKIGDNSPNAVFSKAEMNCILAGPDVRTAAGFRDRAILEVFYSTGVRRAELLTLTVYDVDFDQGLARVHGKGAKDRVIPIGRAASRYVQEYLHKIRPKVADGEAANILFLTMQGRPMSTGRLSSLVASYLRMAGVRRKASCHAFRRTCATEMLRGGADVRYVQEMLGHAHIQTTQRYTKIVPVDLQKAVRKAHPSERGRKKEVEAFEGDGKARFYRFTRKGLAKRNRKRRAASRAKRRNTSPS
jgi:integrase/recombinase XerD